MNIKPLFLGSVVMGKLLLKDRKLFDDYIQKYNGKEVQLTIETRKRSRSNNQNSYYWAVICEMLSRELGYTPEEVHEALKFQFLKIHEDSKLVTVRSTTDLTTVEMEEYLTRIREFASKELGTYIPLPNEISME